MKYEIQTFTLCDGFVNTWTEDDKLLTFKTRSDAELELKIHLQEMREAWELNEIDDEPNPEDYRIVEIAQ